MALVKRKITYRLYSNATQLALLEEMLLLHCRVYNTLLEEHRRRFEAKEPTFCFSDMCQAITEWRGRVEALEAMNAQSLQVTARRAALAFSAFFRRVRKSETPGYPRFKSAYRYPGWGYKTHGDGWKLILNEKAHGKVRISGVGTMPIRGKGRFRGVPKTAEVVCKGGKWYLSVTFRVPEEDVAREKGAGMAAFDWGIDTLLTLAREDGVVEEVANPRWLKTMLGEIKTTAKAISTEESRIKEKLGFKAEAVLKRSQRTAKLNRLYEQLRRIHGKVGRQRHDFYHKLTAMLVSRFGVIITEKLKIKNMSRKPKAKPDPEKPGAFLPNGAGRKAGLNRGILDAAPGMLLSMLKTKAGEAASMLVEADTKRLKPTQRCHACGRIVPKELEERRHKCVCGADLGRDENSARLMLRWGREGEFWLGTSQGFGVLRSPETPPISA